MQRNYAYIRVSTKEQNLSRQLDAIKECGIEINERDILWISAPVVILIVQSIFCLKEVLEREIYWL